MNVSTLPRAARRSPRFWLGYAAAWVPCAVLYAAVFVAEGRSADPRLVWSVVANVASAALLGAGVVWACGRVPYPARSWAAFLAAHSGLASLFVMSWFCAVMLGLSVITTVRHGRWTPVWFDGPARHWQLFAGLMVYAAIAGAAYAAEVARRFRDEEARAAHAEARRADAELQALRAQLDPHFLFNTIHSLMALVRDEPAEAERALERFAGLLRHTLRASRAGGDEVRLEDELRFVRDYLALEQIRLGDRLRVVESVERLASGAMIPAFTLQPLVENAVRYAVAPRAGGGTVTIEARRAGRDLLLRVADDGPGADEEAVATARGLGLRLVRQRLAMRYRDAAELTVLTAPGEGFTIDICLPVHEG